MYGRPLVLLPGGSDSGSETGPTAGRGGTGGNNGKGPGPTRTLNAMGDKDRGLADSAAVHSKWDRDGGTGMARRHLPAVWPRAPRYSHILLRLQRQVQYLPHPRLQEWRPCQGASQ